MLGGGDDTAAGLALDEIAVVEGGGDRGDDTPDRPQKGIVVDTGGGEVHGKRGELHGRGGDAGSKPGRGGEGRSRDGRLGSRPALSVLWGLPRGCTGRSPASGRSAPHRMDRGKDQRCTGSTVYGVTPSCWSSSGGGVRFPPATLGTVHDGG